MTKNENRKLSFTSTKAVTVVKDKSGKIVSVGDRADNEPKQSNKRS